MSHIAMITYGTRGDVQPFIALALRLATIGQRAVIAAPRRYAALVLRHGIGFVPLSGDPSRLMDDLIARAGSNPLLLASIVSQFVLPLASEVMAGVRRACAGARLILHSFLLHTGAHAIARELGVPDMAVEFFPVLAPTGAFASPGFAPLPLGPGYNRLTHQMLAAMVWRVTRLGFGRVAGQPSMPRSIRWAFGDDAPVTQLHAISPQLLPRPNDWPAHALLTGAWVMPQQLAVEAELARFVAHGPPPVVITLGSMAGSRAGSAALAAIVAARAGGRRVVALGTGDAVRADAAVFAAAEADHGWLLPRAAVIVHHGGAGTTDAAARAGVPQVIMPLAADQPFWGERVAALGVGPPPLVLRRRTPQHVAAALQRALAPETVARAAALGAAMRGEDGIAVAMAAMDAAIERGR